MQILGNSDSFVCFMVTALLVYTKYLLSDNPLFIAMQRSTLLLPVLPIFHWRVDSNLQHSAALDQQHQHDTQGMCQDLDLDFSVLILPLLNELLQLTKNSLIGFKSKE